MSDLFEQLAAIQHDIWAHWQRYVQHNKCDPVFNSKSGTTGQLVISKSDAEHWQRQIDTPYAELTEKEKDSDREQVAKFWPLVEDLEGYQQAGGWRELAYAKLGGLRDEMTPEDVEVIQEFLKAHK